MNGDALDRELASLAETISLSNPVTYGHKNEWQTSKKFAEIAAKREGEYAQSLPKTFILTEPKHSKPAFAAAAAAARDPAQPMRPSRFNENGNSKKNMGSESPNAHSSSIHNTAIVVASGSQNRMPLARRGHMDGILQGIPGDANFTRSTQADAFEYDTEMKDMNRDKNTSFHRKRDAYSEYVEARARFSKMHSVN